jgi:hypothetical protein
VQSRADFDKYQRMKLRHAAPALAVWYLMSPPVMRIPRYGAKVNPAAHLNYWKVRGSYASLADCDAAGRALFASIQANPENPPDGLWDLDSSVMSEVAKDLVCVSSDDPRL